MAARNEEFARILREVAAVYELEGVEWKPRAYLRAAQSIESLERDIGALYEEGGTRALEEIPGVGESIAAHIAEYVETGRVREFDELLGTLPRGVSELLHIEGLGPKRVRVLTEQLGVVSVSGLLRAAERGRIRELPRFGARAEQNILSAIRTYLQGQERKSLGHALPIAEEIVAHLRPHAERIAYAGSLRRMRDTIGDVDVLAVARDADALMDAFTRMPAVARVLARGSTRSSVELRSGLHVDIRVVSKESYGAALLYFTGSKQHNIELRTDALRRGLKLSEYGLFRGEKAIAGATEREVYAALGLDWIAPELRDARGEIDAARAHRLPRLVEEGDLRGDLQSHSTHSDGVDSIFSMARAAQARGYAYFAVTDHSPSAQIAHGLSEERLEEQWREIDAAQRDLRVRILKGAEVNILADGTLDYPDRVLRRFDVVVAAVHSSFRQGRREMTDRLLRAVSHPHVHVLAHPTGRVIGTRRGVDADWDAVFRAAAERGTAIEINGQPDRIDLADPLIVQARNAGARFCINSDAHAVSALGNVRFALGQARRAWLTREDVVNTLPLRDFERWLSRRT